MKPLAIVIKRWRRYPAGNPRRSSPRGEPWWPYPWCDSYLSWCIATWWLPGHSWAYPGDATWRKGLFSTDRLWVQSNSKLRWFFLVSGLSDVASWCFMQSLEVESGLWWSDVGLQKRLGMPWLPWLRFYDFPRGRKACLLKLSWFSRSQVEPWVKLTGIRDLWLKETLWDF